jgi:hypothetical protein
LEKQYPSGLKLAAFIDDGHVDIGILRGLDPAPALPVCTSGSALSPHNIN